MHMTLMSSLLVCSALLVAYLSVSVSDFFADKPKASNTDPLLSSNP
jgi:hypothetical protein